MPGEDHRHFAQPGLAHQFERFEDVPVIVYPQFGIRRDSEKPVGDPVITHFAMNACVEEFISDPSDFGPVSRRKQHFHKLGTRIVGQNPEIFNPGYYGQGA
jgi:hypothetical protein